jgi:flagellar biosynthesis protein FliR
MPVNFELPVSVVHSFLLVLTRVSGAFVFVPLPGMQAAPVAARVVLALTVALALWPAWPAASTATTLGRNLVWLAAEAALGIGVGLAVAFLYETLLVAAQAMGLQAGYSYASTVDPATQADSGVLLVVAQLISWLLFLSAGLDRFIIRTFARSLEVWPPGSFRVSPGGVEAIAGLGSVMFSTAVRLALPVLALLVLIDVAFALLGRINAQLQLLTLAFPAKMLAALALFAALAAAFPRIYETAAGRTLRAISEFIGG